MRAHASPPESSSAPIPWHVWCAVLAVTSAMIGVQWDIAWHRSIGRDTFWTAPHIAIYLCGILAGIAAGYLILSTTFGSSDGDGRRASVRVFGFRGPLGAFILAWGGVAMITSAPFDNWWHNAYGLDVKIISPPHTLLALGLLAVMLGALILVIGYMNRADGVQRRRFSRLFMYIGGMILVQLIVFMMERTDRSDMHTGEFYRNIAMSVPLLLLGLQRATDGKWAATSIAAVFSVFQLGLLWILPLFPAVPKLGPVYYPVTHLVPPPFPLLLIAPALALDLLRQRAPSLAGFKLAAAAGALFLVVYFAVQWPFANFLLSPASRNWVFGTGYFGYNTRPYWYDVRGVFSDWETPAQFWRSLGMAAVLALVASRIGVGWGEWMSRIRR